MAKKLSIYSLTKWKSSCFTDELLLTTDVVVSILGEQLESSASDTGGLVEFGNEVTPFSFSRFFCFIRRFWNNKAT